jgi:hypothetical protein
MSGRQSKLDLENMPAPAEGILVTHFLTVRDVARSRAFYADVLGGEVVLPRNASHRASAGAAVVADAASW